MSTALQRWASESQSISGMIPAGSPITIDRYGKLLAWLIGQSQSLARCSGESVVGALAQVAQLGLDLTPATGQAYLVPYGNKCQLQIGYKGFIALVTRSGQVKHVTAYAVYERDAFDFELGTDERISHRPALKDRGPLIAAWAQAVLADGTRIFRVISMDDIEKARSYGQAKRDDSPWKIHPDEMARKTAIRRLARDLVQSGIDLARALAVDDMIVEARNGDAIEGEWRADDERQAPSGPPVCVTERIAGRPATTPERAEMIDRIKVWLGDHGLTFGLLRTFASERAGRDLPSVAEWTDANLRTCLGALGNGYGRDFVAWAEARTEAALNADSRELAPEDAELPD